LKDLPNVPEKINPFQFKIKDNTVNNDRLVLHKMTPANKVDAKRIKSMNERAEQSLFAKEQSRGLREDK
jgi:hypothetical protein